jgi:hypothetical protein
MNYHHRVGRTALRPAHAAPSAQGKVRPAPIKRATPAQSGEAHVL